MSPSSNAPAPRAGQFLETACDSFRSSAFQRKPGNPQPHYVRNHIVGQCLPCPRKSPQGQGHTHRNSPCDPESAEIIHPAHPKPAEPASLTHFFPQYRLLSMLPGPSASWPILLLPHVGGWRGMHVPSSWKLCSTNALQQQAFIPWSVVLLHTWDVVKPTSCPMLPGSVDAGVSSTLLNATPTLAPDLSAHPCADTLVGSCQGLRWGWASVYQVSLTRLEWLGTNPTNPLLKLTLIIYIYFFLFSFSSFGPTTRPRCCSDGRHGWNRLCHGEAPGETRHACDHRWWSCCWLMEDTPSWAHIETVICL